VIVHSTIDLGHNLGLRVVAEGVETQAAQERLTDLGCDTAQGYHLARPMPLEELESWLRRHARQVTSSREPTR
jgi:EAL domain-containing protein (putative c-di-GMP-specific phosphodiesterase class I)